MKKVTSIFTVLFLLMLSTDGLAQDKAEVNFNLIDLNKLKNSIVSELRNDGLVDLKNEEIHLELRTSETVLNGERLNKVLHDKYTILSEEFGIGRGSYCRIYITRKCTAVGNFFEDSFDGKMKGRLNLQEVNPSAI